MKRYSCFLALALLLWGCSDDSTSSKKDLGGADSRLDQQISPADSSVDQQQAMDLTADLGRDTEPTPDGPQTFILRNLANIGEVISLKPSEGEEGQLCAGRLTPPAYPAVIEEVDYNLTHASEPNAQGITCNAALAHQVELYVSSEVSPPNNPVSPRVLQIPAVDPSTIIPELGRQVKATVDPPLTLQQGEQLFVAIKFAGTATEPLCVVVGMDANYEGDRNYWSNAAEPPYNWVQLDSFGLQGTILVRAKGYVGQ